MPAQVLRRAAVGVEFMARAVTSAMESQQLEPIPVCDELITDATRVQKYPAPHLG